MKNLLAICMFCLLTGAAPPPSSAQAVSKCFRADWLQGERVVEFTLRGNRAAGTFAVRGDSTPDTRIYNFKGSLEGDTLTVAFAGDRLPDVSPSEMKSLAWKIARRGGRETLRIKFTGKNYDTNRFEERFADFESCEASSGDANSSDAGSSGAASSYEDLAKRALTIRFKKGASSASLPLDSLARSKGRDATATFFVNAAKSQTLEIEAHGCGIRVYLPNRKLYEYVEWEGEGEKTFGSTQVDRMTIEALPLSGDYLIVLGKLTPESAPDTLTVTARSPETRRN